MVYWYSEGNMNKPLGIKLDEWTYVNPSSVISYTSTNWATGRTKGDDQQPVTRAGASREHQFVGDVEEGRKWSLLCSVT